MIFIFENNYLDLGSFYVPSTSDRNISGEGVFISNATNRRGSVATSMGMQQKQIFIEDEETKSSFSDYWRAFMLVFSASSQVTLFITINYSFLVSCSLFFRVCCFCWLCEFV